VLSEHSDIGMKSRRHSDVLTVACFLMSSVLNNNFENLCRVSSYCETCSSLAVEARSVNFIFRN